MYVFDGRTGDRVDKVESADSKLCDDENFWKWRFKIASGNNISLYSQNPYNDARSYYNYLTQNNDERVILALDNI